jgi:hypothetical protein
MARSMRLAEGIHRKMPWGDYLIDRDVDDDTIAALVKQALGIDRAQLLITAKIPAEIAPEVQLICQRHAIRGDFVLVLSFWPVTPAIERMDGQQFVVALCDAIGCRCLVSDSSPSPLSWILVQRGNRRSAVSLSAEALDRDPEEYVLSA